MVSFSAWASSDVDLMNVTLTEAQKHSTYHKEKKLTFSLFAEFFSTDLFIFWGVLSGTLGRRVTQPFGAKFQNGPKVAFVFFGSSAQHRAASSRNLSAPKFKNCPKS